MGILNTFLKCFLVKYVKIMFTSTSNILFPKEFLLYTDYISSYLPILSKGLELSSVPRFLHIFPVNFPDTN